MRHFHQNDEQEYLTFDNDNVVIVDEILRLPDNTNYELDRIMLIFCTSGKVQIEYDGRPTIINKGDLFLGVPGSVIAGYMLTSDFDCKVVAVRQEEIMSTLENHALIVKNMMYIKNHPVATMTEEDTKNVFDYYHLLCRQIKQEQHLYHKGMVRLLLNSFILEIAGIIVRKADIVEDSNSVHGSKLVEEFIKLVNEDCGHHRLVEYYAEKLNITPKYLCSLVKTSLDRTPSEVIHVVTIKEIERRLRYTDMSIKQVSVSLHFPNTSFFGRYFKQHRGITPNEYRIKYHQ